MAHTCSYYCERPECIRAQRDELRERLESAEAELDEKDDPKLAERLLELAANAPAYSLTSPWKSDAWRDESVRVMHLAAAALGGGK